MLPGKVSIISLLSSKISEEHTKSFYEPTLEAFGGNKDFQLLQVSMFSVQGEQVGGSKKKRGWGLHFSKQEVLTLNLL